ncbi:lycopene cyclase domain-containing protein [Maribacter algicola]|uniref:Lycopene cyclase domain-containing protein n=1 Tax=Meishania litoralis TaxID=3434685 RepID=A0ACC7LK13_9FLAO
MQSYTYLLIDIGCILVPFAASFYPKHRFFNDWKPFFIANGIVGLFFLLWDAYFTSKGIWGFNADYLTGLYIFNLPLEEVLFFVCIPYACVFTYFALKYLAEKNPLGRYQRILTIILIFVLLGLGVLYSDRWYTGMTFLLTATYLIFRLIRRTNLAYHYLAYFLILPFFFISNGILTGSLLDAPIVWYNDEEIIGIRLFTIPVEDTIYGLLLIVLNIDLYEFLRKRFLLQQS